MARNAESRIDMDKAQRNAIDPLSYKGDTPWGSLDVPPEDIKVWKPGYALGSAR